MISSVLYFICFAVLLYNTDKGIRIMASFGMVHTLAENVVYWWFSSNVAYFDLSLYLTLCWVLDISLLFGAACVLSGLRKKLTLALVVPILALQMIVMQYPLLFPSLLDFVIFDSSQTIIEIFILCATFKDNTITEWLKTAAVMTCILIARFIPLFLI